MLLPRWGHLRCFSSSSSSLSHLSLISSLLNKCSTLKHIAQAHAFMLHRGLDMDAVLLSKLILACSLLGFTDLAYSIFKHRECHDVYVYNTMIRSLCRAGFAKDAIFLFNGIQATGLRPDTYSFPFALKAAAHLSVLELGQELHGQIVRLGFGLDVHVLTGLIHMYSFCGGIDHARKVFDRIPQRDVVVWNAMVAGYVRHGELESARVLFEQMPERNVISWTAVIAGYAQMNRAAEAIEIFRRMQLEGGVDPDEIALLAALSACAQLGALDLGEWIHRYIEKRGFYKIVPLMNALIDMYAKCGNIEEALNVFESMQSRSVITWTTMIAGFALHGLGDEALYMFKRMEMQNVKPNDVTFIAILSACSHAGQTDLGRWYFDNMSSCYNVEPKIEHYGCMVDLLGRAGCLKEARDLIRDMPFKANAAIWGALLAAARTCGDVELGEYALRKLIEVEPHNSGNYTLLSNIYAAHGKWEGVGKLRKMMKVESVKKVPGGSSIEVDGTVHEFTSRDGSHPCFKMIYEVLYSIDGHLRICRFSPMLYGE
ncbi:TPR-like protein [Dioscorea alata]|uniref:TPR-like protein n=1 Tax=Dioscorea alata TaxID=55571 RepID=A0ACB7VT36_DIOAL|nr:TPR-like protein [Dioscorea alata]